MWRGWNSITTEDSLPVQNLGYMESINLPPTQLNVVQLTMQKSEQLRQECGEKYMLTTYDLAIAKPAIRIQETEAPLYDKLFIEMGAFHLRNSYFSALGYYLTMSGLDELLVTSEVIGSGSLAGFLAGRHYNRCVRIHPLSFACLSKLHLAEFVNIQYNGKLPDTIKVELENISQNRNPDTVDEALSDEESPLVKLLLQYEEYREQTRMGNHGITPQFYIGYLDMVNYDMLLDRGTRTNDVQLYTYAMGKMLPVFWAANRPNYKRWGVKNFLQ